MYMGIEGPVFQRCLPSSRSGYFSRTLLKMEASSSSEMFYQSTWCHIPDYVYFHERRWRLEIWQVCI